MEALKMAFVTSTEMFKKAYEGGYAVGAFNVNNMEIVQGITEAVKEQNAPLILQVSSGARKYARHAYLVKLVVPLRARKARSSSMAKRSRSIPAWSPRTSLGASAARSIS